jgi:hypothetical protein
MTTSTLARKEAESSAPSSMKAWRVHEFGPPEAMIFETIPRPDPSPGEVLVKVHAAGVGPWDGWIRSGRSAPRNRIARAGRSSNLSISARAMRRDAPVSANPNHRTAAAKRTDDATRIILRFAPDTNQRA